MLLRSSISVPGPAIERDVATWLGYLLVGYYAFLQASLGPLMPFLRSETGFDYTTAGLHFSGFALGMMINGLTAHRVIRFLNRRRTMWGGGIGLALGTTLLTASSHVALTLPSTLLMGYGGSVLGTSIQTMLSDKHGVYRAVVLTESTIVASAFATLAPLAVGFWQESGLSWRAALWMGITMFVLIAGRFHRTELPQLIQPPVDLTSSRIRLPSVFWLFWIVIVLSVSVEWSMIYWGASFLEEEGGLDRTAAATSMSFFLAAMIAGRVIGSRLARYLPGERLLLIAVITTAIGFPLFWFGPLIPLRLLGLMVMGFGIANQYPLTAASALGTMPDRSELASARLSLGAGLALFSAPLLLGWLADFLSVWQAYGIVAVLLPLILLSVLFAARVQHRNTSAPETVRSKGILGRDRREDGSSHHPFGTDQPFGPTIQPIT